MRWTTPIVIAAAIASTSCGLNDAPAAHVVPGPTARYSEGDIVHFPDHTAFLVANAVDSEQRYAAFVDSDPWSGCTLRWVQVIEEFTDPCYGSFWTREGTLVAGPAAHDLVMRPTRVRNDMVEVAVSPTITPSKKAE